MKALKGASFCLHAEAWSHHRRSVKTIHRYAWAYAKPPLLTFRVWFHLSRMLAGVSDQPLKHLLKVKATAKIHPAILLHIIGNTVFKNYVQAYVKQNY